MRIRRARGCRRVGTKNKARGVILYFRLQIAFLCMKSVITIDPEPTDDWDFIALLLSARLFGFVPDTPENPLLLYMRTSRN